VEKAAVRVHGVEYEPVPPRFKETDF
jgi:hypothetical protein